MSSRILHVASSLDYVGTNRQLAWVCRHLTAQGFQTGVVSLKGDGLMASTFRAAGADVFLAQTQTERLTGWLFGLDRTIRDYRPDVVHLWTDPTNIWVRIAVAGRRVPHILATYRTVGSRPSSLNRGVARRLMRATQVCVVNSPVAEQAYLDEGFPAEKLELIPNGIESPPVVTTKQRRLYRDRWGLPENARIIAAVGPLVPHKRLKDLLWTINLLLAIHDDVYLVIMGDGPHRWRLERFARQCHAIDRVRFVGWQSDAPQMLGAMDCLWLASSRESVPNSVLEAMAAGIPVLAADTPATRLVVEHDRTGLLVGIGDRGGFARATHQLLNSPEVAHRLSAAAREYVRRAFPLETMQSAYLNLYRRVLTS